jgi:hypothetical protein
VKGLLLFCSVVLFLLGLGAPARADDPGPRELLEITRGFLDETRSWPLLDTRIGFSVKGWRNGRLQLKGLILERRNNQGKIIAKLEAKEAEVVFDRKKVALVVLLRKVDMAFGDGISAWVDERVVFVPLVPSTTQQRERH